VKRIRINLRARLFIIIAAALVLWIVESFTGAFSMKGPDLLLTQDIIDSADKPFAITVGALDTSSVAGIVAANGGLSSDRNSAFAKRNISASITVFPDRVSMERAFSRGKINMIAESPSAFAADYPSLEKNNPVAFLLLGADSSKPAMFSRNVIAAASDMAGKTVACAASSPAFFFARMISDAAGATEQTKWIFTVTDNESVSLFKSGKADIIAIDLAETRAPEGASPLLSYNEARAPLASVLIAREQDIVLHKDVFASFVSAYFDSRSYLLSQKDSNVKDMFSALKIALPEGAHPAKFIASESENFLFFRLTPSRSEDFFSQFYVSANSGKVGKKTDPLKPSVSINTAPLTSAVKIDAIKPDMFPSPVPAPRKNGLELYSKSFTFSGDNTDIDRKSAAEFRILSRLSSLFPQSVINVSLGGESQDEKNQFYQREIAIRTVLSRYGIPSQAAVIVKGKEPRLSVILPPSVKK
jgi:hypothetical protein